MLAYTVTHNFLTQFPNPIDQFSQLKCIQMTLKMAGRGKICRHLFHYYDKCLVYENTKSLTSQFSVELWKYLSNFTSVKHTWRIVKSLES